MAKSTAFFTLELGFLVRRSVIDEVTSEAWKAGLDCSHERAGSTVRFRVSGDTFKVDCFLLAVRKTFA